MSSKKSLSKLSSLFNEEEWVIKIRSSLEETIEEEDTKIAVSIFGVPKELRDYKIEAYMPQVFAFGPYHHWRTHLYDMERYKLAAARRVQGVLADGVKLIQVVEMFKKYDYKIRCHYHKYLDFNAETLIWMMVIDASFLVEFLQIHATQESSSGPMQSLSRTLSKRIENEKTKIFFNLILRDIMMLENQMPLFLLRKLLNLQFPSKDHADEELIKILSVFFKEVSPFKSQQISLTADIISIRAHFLDILYSIIVPNAHIYVETEEITEENAEGEEKEEEIGDISNVKKMCSWTVGCISKTSAGPLYFVKRVIFARPVKFLVQFPWKVVSALPIVSLLKEPVENFFSQLIPDSSKKEETSNHPDRPPLAEEIAIPSVSELYLAGVSFVPTQGDITSIVFDTKTVTMYLPVISLDVNTEVVLRNLVAYEASIVSGALVFTRYTELMNGIIDTDEDVKILRQKGIIVNRMKSDTEVTKLWNGMSKSVRLTKVKFLDDAIKDVNKYYRSRWKVKGKKFFKKYVFGSWQILTFLAAAMLLMLTCVQAFCSVYSCSAHVTKYTSPGDN